MKKIFFPYCFIFLLFSCTSSSNKKESAESRDSSVVAFHLVKQMKEYKGIYHPGQFKSAESSELFTFNDSVEKMLDSLYNKILPNAYPNQTVFMNFKGIADSFPTNTGFRTSVTELISMELKNAFNSAIPYDYWCMGNEPFWQIQISEKENLIDFYDPMIPKTYHFNFSKAKMEEGKTIYTDEDKASGNSILITISNEKCSDGMSERKNNYSSEVFLNGKTYKGCAIKFNN